MRDGTLAVTQDVVSLVLEGVDRIKDLLEGLEQTGEEPDLNDTPLIARLDAMVASATTGSAVESPAEVETSVESVAETAAVEQPVAESQPATAVADDSSE